MSEGRADGGTRPESDPTPGTPPPHDAPVAPDATAQIEAIGPRDLVVGLLTYNNAATVRQVVEEAVAGLQRHFPSAPAAIVNADAGSSDATPELLDGAGLPVVHLRHGAPLGERLTVPFHGVPGRNAALHAAFDAAHRLGARALVVLEADVVSVAPDWLVRLAGPVIEQKADLVAPAYARHRYDGTITNLLVSPLVRALYGRRLHQPLGGAQALSARLLEHLLIHPKWDWRGRVLADLWVVGAAIADGFAVRQSWLGHRTVRSQTRTRDLPTMIAQTLGAAFTLMERHLDLWLEVRGSEPMAEEGEPVLPSIEAMPVDVAKMVDAFRLGLRDLGSIWELILAPETLGEVLALELSDRATFRFSDDLWARVVYDFALGHHYDVVHRDHLLRSLVPLYLGRTAAFVLATQGRSAVASEAMLEGIGAAFERQKPYLVERWR
jgi:hypothetical protein